MGSPTRLNRSPQTSNGEFIRDLPRFQRILPEKPGTFFGEDGVDNAVQELNRPHRSGTQWRPLFISAMRSLFVCCLIRLALLDVYHVLYGPLPEDDSPPPPLPLRNATDTERIADFWYDFDHLVSAVNDYDTWFDMVVNATSTLDAIYVEISPHWQQESPKIYEELGINLASRKLHIQVAEAEWGKFTKSRELMVLSMLGQDEFLRVFVDGQSVDKIRPEDLRVNWNKLMWKLETMKQFPQIRANYSIDDRCMGGPAPIFGNQTEEDFTDPQNRAVLESTARGITEQLIQMHTDLFERWDNGQLHLREAQRLERLITKEIRYRSRLGFTWQGYHGKSLCVLLVRIEGLKEVHANLRESLVWLKERFVDQEHDDKVEDWTAWVRSAKELLRGWAVITHDMHEAVLYMLRRRDVANKCPPRACAEASWTEWKERNCGATSCYDDKDVWSFNMISGMSKPKAGVATDEKAWIKSLTGDRTPRIPRNVYDKACCQRQTSFHDGLKNGRDQPRMGWR